MGFPHEIRSSFGLISGHLFIYCSQLLYFSSHGGYWGWGKVQQQAFNEPRALLIIFIILTFSPSRSIFQQVFFYRILGIFTFAIDTDSIFNCLTITLIFFYSGPPPQNLPPNYEKLSLKSINATTLYLEQF